MIEHLGAAEHDWLARFFALPNELNWSSLTDGSAPAAVSDQVRRWLRFLTAERSSWPLILPFVRGGNITGWYATTQGQSGGYELRDEINAWLGPTWLDRLDQVPENSSDPMAAILRERFGGTVFRFTGPNDDVIRTITTRLGSGLIKLTP